ncbi:MAG: SlyX family protein [Desulfobacterales bacterium]|nr:SlyX family protein [Desulfobacterales bacterium]
MKEKWIEMETKISYQEYMIEQLNGVVTNQQERIDQLESEIARMEHLMRDAQVLRLSGKEAR